MQHVRHPRPTDRRRSATYRDLGIWRDTGTWDRLRTVGTTTGDAGDLVPGHGRRVHRGQPRSFARGVRAHTRSADDHRGCRDRAVAQTRWRSCIERRSRAWCATSPASAVLRFLREAGGRWGLVLRQPVYEKDRIDPAEVRTAATRSRAAGALPEGYRHLAYLQAKHGYTIKPDMPGVAGPELEALYGRGAAWLGVRRCRSYLLPADLADELLERRELRLDDVRWSADPSARASSRRISWARR